MEDEHSTSRMCIASDARQVVHPVCTFLYWPRLCHAPLYSTLRRQSLHYKSPTHLRLTTTTANLHFVHCMACMKYQLS